MKGYLRGVFYWVCCLEKLFFSMLGGVVVVFAVFAFVDNDMEQFYRWTLSYMPMMGVIFFIAGGMNIANAQIPMAMSLGTTRKEAAWGVIIAMHGIALQLWILTIVYNAFLPPTYVVDSYVKVCGVLFLFGCAGGNGLGAVVLRFGSKVGLRVYLCSFFLLICGGIFIVTLAGATAVISFISGMGVLVAAILFDAAVSAVYRMSIRNYEVRV